MGLFHKIFKRREFVEDKIWLHVASEDARMWFHWGKTTWHYEGYLGKRAHHNSIGLHLGGEENDFTFSLGIKGLFNFYFGVESFLPSKWMEKFGWDGRHYGITLYEEYLWLDFHRDEHGYAEGWKGIHWSFNWENFLYGKSKYSEVDVLERRRFIEMPEGLYMANFRIFDCTWTWKRFKKPLKITRVEVTPDIPIPIPGKGENSWDIDDDARFSSTFPCEDTEEARVKFAAGVMRDRERRASKSWVPFEGFDKGILATRSDKALMDHFGESREYLESGHKHRRTLITER